MHRTPRPGCTFLELNMIVTVMYTALPRPRPRESTYSLRTAKLLRQIRFDFDVVTTGTAPATR
jgi:hypothetical protein